VVDAVRLARLLRRIDADIARLRPFQAVDGEALLADEVRLGFVKYTFVTLIEGCIDAAHHIVASERLATPETNAEAMIALARHGLLDRELAQVLARAVGFRNVLVHRYADVDDGEVTAQLGRLGDLAAFTSALAGLLGADPGGDAESPAS
jgi:uncharacterized protein YutE (UPF0331/DUF86 family)